MKDNPYGAVIRAARAEQGLNQQALAERLGISRNTVAGWETGHSRPGLEMVPSLCRVLHISLARFFGVRTAQPSLDRSFLDRYHALSEGDREVIRWEVEALLERRKERAGVSAPVSLVSVFESDLGAAAGFGAPLGEAQGRRMYLIRDEVTARADEVVRVSGHSMEPTFQDGDRILLQHTGELRPGEIGVFLADGEGYIKEYQEDGLHSHNPAYGVMSMKDYSDIRCVGRVLGKVTPARVPTGEQIQKFENAERAWGGSK